MVSSSLPTLLTNSPSDVKARDDLEVPEGKEVVVSTPLLSRDAQDSRQLSRLDDEPSDASMSPLGSYASACCMKCELFHHRLFGHRLALLIRFIDMHIDMGFDGNTLVGFGLKGMPGHQWLLRISILGPQLAVWYFLNMNSMSGHGGLMLISLCPVVSLLLCLVLESGPLSSLATFIFCLSLEPTRLLVQCWNGGVATELIWFSIADGLVEAPISACLTLVSAMMLTEIKGDSVDIVWCASVLWSLFTIARASSELHSYGENKSVWEQMRMATFVKLPGVISQVLGHVFFVYLTRRAIEGVPCLEDIEYIALLGLVALEVALNYSILSSTCERLPLEVALLFSCAMCVTGPPGFLQKLDRARWPHAVLHAALNCFMAIIAFLISPPLSEHALLMTGKYSMFVFLYLASLPCSLAAAFMTTDTKSMPLEEAARQTQARFAAALKSKDRITSNLLMIVDGATPCIEPELLCTGDSSSRKWSGICLSKQNGKLYCAPCSNSEVLVIDPELDTLGRIETGTIGSNKWEGIAEAENGKLYCAPCNHSAVLVIDPLSGKTSLIETGIEGSTKWLGIAKASNGKLYCAPCRHSGALVIDPSTDTTSIIETKIAKDMRWRGIAASSNGKLYCAPYCHESVLVIDSSTDCVSLIEIEAKGANKWCGMIEARNGKLYAAPENHSSILVIDPATHDVSYIETHDASLSKWHGLVQSADDKLYCAPFSHKAVLVIDTVKEDVELIDTGAANGQKWSDITTSPNGIMYCSPCSTSCVLKIDPAAMDNWDQNKTLRDLGL